uniref:Pentatricopeptide repeat-containing protein At3g51320 n=1 Tax=Anthurium amnicola TaxID=1678845 RepID=A0A1D1Y3C8_9ARAE
MARWWCVPRPLLHNRRSRHLHAPADTGADVGRISLYHPSLRPLRSCRTLRQLLQAHAHLLVTGLFDRDPFAASRVLKAAADLDCPDYAALVFCHLRPAPDAFCFNTLLKAKSRSTAPARAVAFYFEVARVDGFAHNSYAFPPLLNACARIPSLDDGEKCHGQAVKHGVDAVVHVQNALIHMYASCGAVECARVLFDGMALRDVVSWNSMVDGYVKAGDLAGARNLFDLMPERNVVSWNIMISGYLKGRAPECGLGLFTEMGKVGLKGSMTTMVGAVTTCARLGRLTDGRSVHGFCIRNFAEVNLILETALVDMYGKCQSLDVAQLVFDGIQSKNLVCWNAMILGHCIHGRPEDGLALFEDMVRRGSEGQEVDPFSREEDAGVSPDEVTFVGVLCACTRAGMLSKGKMYFDQMINVYNLMPTFAHYWCMANLYNGLGLVEEAEEVLRCMPEETESLVWSGVFWLCRFHGCIELGERIAKRLIDLEPFNSSRYALLWNIYGAAGRWEDASKIKEMMKERGVMTMPDRSLVDLNEIVHNFKVGDRSRPEMECIYTLMDELAERFRLRTHSVGSMEGGSIKITNAQS